MLHAVLIDHRRRYALCVKGPRGVELAAVDAVAVAFAGQAGGSVMGGLGAQLCQGVAQALTGQDFGVEALLLVRAAVHSQHFQGVEVVLRYLPK
ncbi:hypothetical protein D3C73_1309970 [compost metagenome]